MRLRSTWGLGLVWLAILGMLMPVSVLRAAKPTTPTGPANDIVLSSDGVLRGQLVTPQGRGLPGVHVLATSGTRELGSTVTGKDGRFQFRGLKGGVLTLSAGQTRATVRTWTSKAAPPAARKDLLIVAGRSQALGQSWGGFKSVITNPWVIAGVVAAAVAIPVAIHNSNDDEPASP